MQLSRRSRFATALYALISVLFMQLAVAAYACPSLQPMDMADIASAATVVSASEHDTMAGCEGVVDIEQPSLCHAHSQVGYQSLDKPAMPDVQPSLAVVLVPVIGDVHAAYRPLSPPADAVALAPDSSPPLSIRNCCFRI